MKLKVEKEFTDKFTDEKHKIGDVIEVEAKRGKELLADFRKLVTEVKEERKKSVKAKKSEK